MVDAIGKCYLPESNVLGDVPPQAWYIDIGILDPLNRELQNLVGVLYKTFVWFLSLICVRLFW